MVTSLFSSIHAAGDGMAAVGTPAHLSNKTFNSSTFLPSLSQNSNSKPKQPLRVRCALSPPKWQEGRRLVSISLALSHLLFIPNRMPLSLPLHFCHSLFGWRQIEKKMHTDYSLSSGVHLNWIVLVDYISPR